MNETVLYSADRGVVTLTLNRPQALNALDPGMAQGLSIALDRLESDAAARAVVITGAGDAFMAGGDIKFFGGFVDSSPEQRRLAFERFIGGVHPTILRLRRLPQPVIAAVNGPCAGIGMSLMLACDLALAAENSLFTLAYIHLAVSPDGGSTFFLPRHVGAKQAAAIALLGDRFDAAKALALGLVNEVVPKAELAARATALARRLATGPREALAATKHLLSRSLDHTLEEQLEAEARSFAQSAATGDFTEAVSAFIAKRPPRFAG